MDLESRTRALLAVVEQYRARREHELLAPARDEARSTVKAALGEARRRVGTAVAEERRRRAAEVGAAEAALATERRLASQSHAVRLLGAAWRELRVRLIARWMQPETRARWAAAHLLRARDAIPRDTPWRIEYHPAWSARERAVAEQTLRAGGVASVQFEARDDIAAGLRVVSGHNVLDATADGLLADRAQLEGQLLHYLDEEATA